jgi:predicted acylesterase/phospholipase RssA
MSENREMESVPTFAGVFGGGGLFGIGYALGVIHGLRDQGIDLTNAPMLGTSAGSWAAAATALNVSLEELLSLPVPSFPNPKPGALATVAKIAFGDRTAANVRAVVTSVPRLKRGVLSGEHTPLAQLVAASSAVPGLLAPQRINGTWYVDGGVRSGVSVDLAGPAHTLVVIAPLAGAMFGPFGNYVEGKTDKEQEKWLDEYGGRFLEFSPRQTTADIATRPQHLFSRDRAIEAYHRGRAETSDTTIM